MERTSKNIYLNITNITIWLFLLNLGIRLVFINWNTAEFTDGIEYMNYRFFCDWRSPAYPLLIKMVHLFGLSLEASGRFASILMTSLCIFPIFYIAEKVYDRKTAIYSCVFFTASPIIFQNSIRVLSGNAYLFFFLWVVYYCWKVFMYGHKKDILLAVLLSGIAINTRAEAMIFLPLLVIFFFMSCYKFKIRKTIYLFFVSGFFWYIFAIQFLIVAKILNTNNYLALYKWGVVTTTLPKLFNFFISYLKILPFIIVYPIFLLFVYGIIINLKQKLYLTKQLKIWLLLTGYILSTLLIALSLHLSWDPRFLISLIPIVLIISGFGLTHLDDFFKKKWFSLSIIAICLIFSVAISALLLESDKDYFGDIRRSAEYIKENVKDAVIYSDEIQKTSFWAGHKVRLHTRDNIKANQYIALHSFYTNLANEIKFIQNKYNIKIIYLSKSKTIPIFRSLRMAPWREAYIIENSTESRRLSPEHISLVLYLSSLNQN